MEKVLSFLMENLEIVVAVVGGVSVAAFMFIRQSGSNENDLTPLYIKYKRYTDNIAKATKSIF